VNVRLRRAPSEMASPPRAAPGDRKFSGGGGQRVVEGLLDDGSVSGASMEDWFSAGTGRNELSSSLEFMYYEFEAPEQILRPSRAPSCNLLVEDLAANAHARDADPVGTAVNVLQTDGRRVSAYVLETIGDAVRVIYSDCSAVASIVELVPRSRVSSSSSGDVAAPAVAQPSPLHPPPRSRRSKPRLWSPNGLPV
jgi:hypothetical protein